MLARLAAVVLTLLAGGALADRGAVSVEAGGGMSGLVVAAPYATEAKPLNSLAPAVLVGGRYALRDSLEVSGSAYFEFPVALWHNGVTVVTPNGSFPGSLTHQMYRYGGQAGARFVLGMVWRLHLGLELGWSHRVYSGFQHIDDTGAALVDYKLGLPDFSTDNLVVAPVVGLEWAAGDHWSLAIMPRAQALLGPDATFALVVPLTFSWSFYL